MDRKSVRSFWNTVYFQGEIQGGSERTKIHNEGTRTLKGSQAKN